MKRIVLISALLLALSTAALAEASAADDFFANLSKTWDSFLLMTEEAGQNVSNWAEESGLRAWTEDAISEVGAWLEGTGLSEWAGNALSEINGWIEESGIRDWTEQTAEELKAFIDENRPAVEAWLQQVGQEVEDAWNTLAYPEGHSSAELEQALQTVTDALEEAGEAAAQP